MIGRATTALGITQIVGWGTTYYCTAVLFSVMAADTGWGLTLAYAAFSWAMLVSGLVSRWMGALVESIGERRVMTAGSLGIAAGLLAVATAHHPVQLFVAWTLLGVAMRAALYETAFSALARMAGAGARRAISILTLYGGLASTLFWPLGHWMAAQWGWRGAFLAYAVCNLLICVPLHHFFLPRPGDERAAATAPGSGDAQAQALARGSLPPAERDRALLILSALLAAHSFVFSSLAAHVLTVLQALGLAAAAAVTMASMKGVAQVAARFVELSLQRYLGAMTVGMISTGLLPVGLLLLDIAAPNVLLVSVGCLVYGASNGLITIVRGAVTLQLFGHAGYGATLGRIAAPGLIAGALAPMSYAAAIEHLGHHWALAMLTVISCLGFAGMWRLTWIQNRSARNTPTSDR